MNQTRPFCSLFDYPPTPLSKPTPPLPLSTQRILELESLLDHTEHLLSLAQSFLRSATSERLRTDEKLAGLYHVQYWRKREIDSQKTKLRDQGTELQRLRDENGDLKRLVKGLISRIGALERVQGVKQEGVQRNLEGGSLLLLVGAGGLVVWLGWFWMRGTRR